MRNSTTHKLNSNRDIPGPGMDLAGHLYDSFLHGFTADVILRVAGTWCAIYRLHRVVLIQAGFFRTLFTSDFEEAKSERQEIDLVFDDTNITRAAFEVCIGRLYGGGPPLYIYPEFIPNPAKPLTSAFPFGPPITSIVPDKHQPASPKFLLSLLATSLYLEIPSIASHALSSILATVGPYTVINYLNFARGKPTLLNAPDNPAVGLEHVAEINSYHSEAGDSTSIDETASVSSTSLRGSARTSLRFYYGAISDKIGEACACWLARWGQDIFAYEEINACSSQPTSRRRADTISPDHFGHRNHPVIFTSFRPGQGLAPRWIRALVSSDTFFVADELARYTFAKRVVELRRTLRRNAGEPSVSGKGKETQHHGFVELPDEEAEEREWTDLFENGIYYANMTPAELIAISTDISPSTNRPYVPLHVLQAANWEHARLRQIISTSLNSPGGTERERKDLGIGTTGADIYIAQMQTATNLGHAVLRQYFLVPHDQSLRVGDTINTPGTALAEGNIHNNISMDQLFQQSFSPHARTSSGSNAGTAKSNEELPTTSNERTFFGLLPDTLDTLLRHSPLPSHNDDFGDTEKQTKILSAFSSRLAYTTHPPFRFSIEFWDLDLLKEKQRLYSQTVWYAGSLFNVYVQVVKKKEGTSGGERNRGDRERGKENVGSEMQLGIYLHRQSTVESIPPRSAPSPGVVLPQELRREGFDPDAPEVAEHREGESVLIGMAPLQSVRSGSPQVVYSGSRRDNDSGSSWLRTHARGPSLSLALGSGGSGSGSGAISQSPQRSGTPLSLSLTRSRTPINNNTSGSRARPRTGSPGTPSSSSTGSTGVLSSSLPNETLNIQFMSLVPPNPTSVNTEPASTPNSPVVGHISPSRLMTSNGNGPGGASITSSSPPYTTPSPPPSQQPYRDPRQVVSVYFSVYCASATGSRQTRFRSGPDVFKIGQSWGWKSGGLLGSGGGAATKNDTTQIAGGRAGKVTSFRATVILGVV